MKLNGTWRNNLKKLICGVTALALVFCLLPVGALAAGETEETREPGLWITPASNQQIKIKLLEFGRITDDNAGEATDEDAGLADGVYEIDFKTGDSLPTSLGFLVRYSNELGFVGVTFDNQTSPDWKWHFSNGTGTYEGDSTNSTPGAARENIAMNAPAQAYLEKDMSYTVRVQYVGKDLSLKLKKQGEQNFSYEATHTIAENKTNTYTDAGNKGGIAIRFNQGGKNTPVLIQRIKQFEIDGGQETLKKEVDYTNYSGEWSTSDYAIRLQQYFTVNNNLAAVELVRPATGETEQPAAKHIAPLKNTLAEDSFENGDNWKSSSESIKIGNKEAYFNSLKGTNRIDWNKGKIEADKFLISFDLTSKDDFVGTAPDTNPEAAKAADLSAEFMLADQSASSSDRLAVRFKLPGGTIKIGKATNGTEATMNQPPQNIYDQSKTFTWEKDKPLGIDILVDRSEGTITVYVDGTKGPEVTNHKSDIQAMERGYFAFSGQYNYQNFAISNFKITTDEEPTTDPGPDPDPGTDPTPGEHLTQLSRTLAEDNFANGDNWTKSNNSIAIENGKVSFSGLSATNRIDWNSGKIRADKFLIQFDLIPSSVTANGCDINAEFMLNPETNERLVVRFKLSTQTIKIGKTTDDTEATLNKNQYASGTFTWSADQSLKIDILVDRAQGTITVYVDGDKKADVTNHVNDIKAMEQGNFAFSAQWANQTFDITNFKITTDEEQTGTPIPFTLGTPAGGTITVLRGADEKEGKWYAYAGDTVVLEAMPDHGYVFDEWESSVNSLALTNNRFTMPDSVQDLTITAKFTEREAGSLELWYDDFGYEALNEANHPTHNGKVSDNKYDMKDDPDEKDKITLVDGTLRLGAMTDKGNYVMIPTEVAEQLAGRNYRITVDAWKAESAGTMQIMFNGKGDTAAECFANRTVLIINQNGQALFKVFSSSNGGDGMAQKACDFKNTPVTYVLEVKENVATLIANGKEITSYDFTNTWTDGAAPTVALINMTENFTVGYDNLKVELLPNTVGISVETTLNGQADNDYTAGTVVANKATAATGETVTLTVTEKVGYKLESLTAKALYETIKFTDNKNGTWSFTVPDEASGAITVVANFVPADPSAPRGYYIDSAGGDDSNNGTIEHPWKSLNKLHDLALNPGDTVYLKRGSTFDAQQLTFKGSGGIDGKRITVTAYGDGDSLPRLNGNGAVTNVVELTNMPYLTIENLEITNTTSSYNADWSGLNKNNNQTITKDGQVVQAGQLLRAINIFAKDYGVVSDITVQNCYIHDINGDLANKWNGGIFFDVTGNSIPTKFDNILIENNTIIDVDRSAIKLVRTNWCNQWEGTPPHTAGGSPSSWYPSTNVVVRGNFMERIGGDGITVRDVDGALVEHNLAKDCDYQYAKTEYNVGIWPYQAANTVIQYNEAYNTHSTLDGQGLDLDHASAYNVMQYNYSHDNEGGFMLIMGGYPHTGSVVRYNISRNDKDKVFELSWGIAKGIMIYNNTVYSDQKLSNGIVKLTSYKGVKQLNDIYIFNNLFVFPSGQETFYAVYQGNGAPSLETVKSKVKLYNNGYVGFNGPTEDEARVNVVLEDPADLSSVLAGADGSAAHTGSSDLLSGYQLAEGSRMIDAGVTMEQALAYFNGSEAIMIEDRTDWSPRELYDSYYQEHLNDQSLQYVMADHFPNINGVNYNVDFFGNRNLAGSAPDIGAAEYGATHEHTLTKTEAKEATCEADGNIAYWHCANCGKYFKAESAGENDVIQIEETVITATGHDLQEVEATASTCTEAGHSAYWKCTACGKMFSDKDMSEVLVEIPALPLADHTLDKVDEVSATATADGVKEHWKCSVCNKLFEDEAGTKETTLADLTIPKDTSGSGGNTGDNPSDSPSPDPNPSPDPSEPGGTPGGNNPGGSTGGNTGGNTGGSTGGTSTETVTSPEGVKGTTTKDRDGNVSSVEVTVPANAANAGGVVTAPVEVESKSSTAQAPEIDIKVSGGSAKVEIPVSNVSHGTVAVVVDKDGKETVLRDCVVTKDGVVLNVDGNVTVKIVENGRTFPDTASVPWAEDAIAFTTARELFQGTGTDFEPNRDTNRAMVVTLLYRLEYEPDIASAGFADVLGDQWYTDAVNWGQDSGVVQGYSSSAFGPEDPVTREQMALMLYRYAQLNGMDTSARADLSGYVDSDHLSDWAKDAMQWAVATGLFTGHGDGVLDPSGNATRAQVAVLLMRFCEQKALS